MTDLAARSLTVLRVCSLLVAAIALTLVAAGVWAWLPGPGWLRAVLALALAAVLWWAGWWLRSGPWLWSARAVVLAMLIVFLSLAPQVERDWQATQMRSVRIDDRDAADWVLHDVRRARYERADPVSWDSLRVAPASVDEVWLGICPFSPGSELAHVFLSFGYRDAAGTRRYLAVSPEIRCQRGERYHPLVGCFRRYELCYVVADEGDIIALRTNHRREDLRLYPLAVTPQVARSLFEAFMRRAERLGQRPEWYHSLWNSCGSNLLTLARRELDDPRLARSPHLLTPGRFDLVAWRRGLLAVPESIGDPVELRARYAVHERARRTDPDAADFSVRIRAGLP